MLEQDSLQKAFTYITPGPLVLLTTNDGKKDNVCTISWMMAMDYCEKCHIAIATGAWNYSFFMMRETEECCICIPSADMIEKVVDIGMCCGEEVSKFEKFNLTPIEGEIVKSPLIEECIASLECKVIKFLEEDGLVILECVNLWVDKSREFEPTIHSNGDGTFRTDSKEVINLRDKMRIWVPKGSERF